MHQTSIYLDEQSLEVVEKYFRGKLSLSGAVRTVVEKWYGDGCRPCYFCRESTPNAFYRVRVSLPDELLSNLQPGTNLSFSIREYLKTSFL